MVVRSPQYQHHASPPGPLLSAANFMHPDIFTLL